MIDHVTERDLNILAQVFYENAVIPMPMTSKPEIVEGLRGVFMVLGIPVNDGDAVLEIQLMPEFKVQKVPESIYPSGHFRRPALLTYRGIRVDLDDYLWGLYLRAGEDAEARRMLYSRAGSGGWDDVCRDCPKHRYEHGTDHFFISEEQ